MESETIVYKGIKFRRYPESKRRQDRVYYTPGIHDKQQGIKRLHEEIWMDAHGDIPAGHHIHHADHDPLNNDISNLHCELVADHHRHHAMSPEGQARLRSPEHRAVLARGRELAKVWHASPEGRAWHSQHGLDVWAERKDKAGTCDQCGNAFLSKRPVRFCSNNCKSAWRRVSGVDQVHRACEWCSEDYTVDKYSKTRFCSRTCGGMHRRATPRRATD